MSQGCNSVEHVEPLLNIKLWLLAVNICNPEIKRKRTYFFLDFLFSLSGICSYSNILRNRIPLSELCLRGTITQTCIWRILAAYSKRKWPLYFNPSCKL